MDFRNTVYVAGSYSGDNLFSILSNIKKGIQVCARLIKDGYAVFCPWLDYQFLLHEDLKVGDLMENSMAWLPKADVMVVLPNSEDSKGTREEINTACGMGKPIVFMKNYDNNFLRDLRIAFVLVVKKEVV